MVHFRLKRCGCGRIRPSYHHVGGAVNAAARTQHWKLGQALALGYNDPKCGFPMPARVQHMFGWFRREPSHVTERRQRLADALAGYPPYEPPDWGPDDKWGDAHWEYVRFFLDNRSRRLEALRAFLAKFGVDVTLKDSGIMAVSSWFPTYADLLVDDLRSDAVSDAYHEFAAPWAGRLLGLNTIFDIGVFFGECMLSRKPKMRWKPVRGPEAHCVTHFIWGQRGGRLFDPINYMYTACNNVRAEKLWRGKTFAAPDHLYRAIQGNSL
jgi:hypothetical protein